MEERKTNQHAYVNKAVLDQEVRVIVQYLIIMFSLGTGKINQEKSIFIAYLLLYNIILF